MKIGGDQSLSVVDQNEAALEVQARFGKGHLSARRRSNRCPDRGGQINPKMGTPGLAIEDALASEPRRAPGPDHRHDEAIPESVQVRETAEALRLAFALGGDAGEEERVCRRDLVCRQTIDLLDIKITGGDGQGLAGGTVWRGDGQDLGERGVAVETEEKPAVGRGHADNLAVQIKGSERCRPTYGVATLDEPARQIERRGRCGNWGAKPDQSRAAKGQARQKRPAVQAEVSCQRFRASAGLA